MIWGIWRWWTMWEKWAAAGWSLVIYCACLPIFIDPFSLFYLCGGVSRKSPNRDKGNAKSGKDLQSTRGGNPGPFTCSLGWGSTPHLRTWCSSPESGRRAGGLGGQVPPTHLSAPCPKPTIRSDIHLQYFHEGKPYNLRWDHPLCVRDEVRVGVDA